MPPTVRALKRYVERDRWTLVRSTNHWNCEEVLADCRVLRTKVSRALRREIPRHLWERTLRHQLQTTEAELRKKTR